MTENGYPWDWPGAIRATLSWGVREEGNYLLSLLFQKRDATQPLPQTPMMGPTMDGRDIRPESPMLDSDSVTEWAETQLRKYFATTRRHGGSGNSDFIADWDLAPKD